MLIAETQVKRCGQCGTLKPITDFHRDSQKNDGRHPWCAVCKNAKSIGYYKRWTPRQRELHRSRSLRSKYGISMEMLDALYEQQEGCCAICGIARGKPATGDGTRAPDTLHVDHNHKTGVVRGLLCFNCNGGLGQFKERVDVLVRAAAYLVGDDLSR